MTRPGGGGGSGWQVPPVMPVEFLMPELSGLSQQAPPAAAVERTKVSMDARGLLCVAHVLRVAGGGGSRGGGAGAAAAGGGGGRAREGDALVKYVVQPLADDDAEDDDRDDYVF